MITLSKHIDRVKYDLKMISSNCIKCDPCALWIVNNMSPYRLDRNCDSVRFCVIYNLFQILQEENKSFLFVTLWTVSVFNIRCTGLCSDKGSTKPCGKADVRFILLNDLVQFLWIRVCEVEIASVNSDINSVFAELTAQVCCQPGSKTVAVNVIFGIN